MTANRGPLPKRAAERRRRNKTPGATSVEMVGDVRPAPLPQGMHPVARRWYNSLKQSGQAEYFEPSDWAAAVYVASAMTENLAQSRFSSQLFAAVWAAMEDLLTTEQARRRSRLEVERSLAGQGSDEDKPTALNDYKARLGS